jgi:hypothetical protein
MKYYLYLDECGDHNLANFDPSFPIFTLCGILISEEDNRLLNARIFEMKRTYWGEKKVILHSRDIRKCEKGFEILFDLGVKKSFYEDVDAVMAETDYTIVACSIMKERYIRKYGRLNDDVYGLSLSFIMERAVYYLESMNDPDAQLQVIVEKRGKREDASLLSYYNEVFDRGTYHVKAGRFKNYIKGFEFRDKKDDIIGLQIADLAAYPITRHVLDNEAYNRAFEVVEGKIYTQNGRRHGLKIFP